ncbi:respiratory nitrate reductase subunit gamma [Kitasatospora sp. NPDC051914]|uniref:respiratory nitrate reductase subunit gamma n=1 Tax=Kitasatospora sp. NPDC051914 TaxID=3154945 RepID=UPI00342E7605
MFAFWPFSRPVHVFSAPLGHLTRPYIVYRSRDPRLGAAAPRLGAHRGLTAQKAARREAPPAGRCR